MMIRLKNGKKASVQISKQTQRKKREQQQQKIHQRKRQRHFFSSSSSLSLSLTLRVFFLCLIYTTFLWLKLSLVYGTETEFLFYFHCQNMYVTQLLHTLLYWEKKRKEARVRGWHIRTLINISSDTHDHKRWQYIC